MQTGPYSIPSIIAYTPGAAVGGVRSVNQTADVNNSSNTTPTDVTGLSFALVSGTRYHFKFVVQGRSAATTTGLGFCFSAPAMTFSHFKIKNQQGNAGTDQYYESSSDDDLTAVLVNASVIANNTDYIFIIEGICQPSENGTLQLRCRSEVDTSQITVKNGIGYLVDPNLEAPTSAPHGITDNHIVTIDDASAADNEYAKFTADGVEGRTYAEVRTDLVIREVITADRTYYVRADGSDSNTGLVDSAGGAWLTPQKAIDVLTGETLDFGGKIVTVQFGAGTYAPLHIHSPWSGGGELKLVGDITTPANVEIESSFGVGWCIFVTPTLPGRLYINGFKLDNCGTCLQFDGIGVIEIGKLIFGDCNNAHIASTTNASTIFIVDDYEIDGDALVHYAAYAGLIWLEAANDITITLTGTPVIDYFADAENQGGILAYAYGVTYTGAATGQRYYVESLGSIATGGGGATFFPGDVAGYLGTGYYD